MDLVEGRKSEDRSAIICHKRSSSANKELIDKSQVDSKCRMCKEKDETITHIVSACLKLAQKEYKRKRDNVAKAIHLDLWRKGEFEQTNICWDQILESVLEIGNNFYYKLLCDFRDWTDKEIQATRPDLVITDKREKSCQKVEVAIPGD